MQENTYRKSYRKLYTHLTISLQICIECKEYLTAFITSGYFWAQATSAGEGIGERSNEEYKFRRN